MNAGLALRRSAAPGLRRRAVLALMALLTVGCADGAPPDTAGEARAADADTGVDTASRIAPDSLAQSAAADTDPVPAELADSVRAALDRLVRGRGADTAGSHTWFSAETAGVVGSVAVDSIGHAVVDFADLRPLIPNASSSAGSEMLLNELNTTVFSVSGVRSVEYRMEGSCDLFWEWLQYSCQTVTRGFIDDEADVGIQDTFWNTRFAMLTDRFGVNWMFNREKAAASGRYGAA